MRGWVRCISGQFERLGLLCLGAVDHAGRRLATVDFIGACKRLAPLRSDSRLDRDLIRGNICRLEALRGKPHKLLCIGR